MTRTVMRTPMRKGRSPNRRQTCHVKRKKSKYLTLSNEVNCCLTSQLMISQSYMWRHIDVQAVWRSWDLRSGSQRHRYFAGFFNVPVQAPTFLYGDSPVRARGVEPRMCPPCPQRDRKRRLNGAVCRNHCIKRVVPCRCLDGHVKEPYEMSMALGARP